MNSKERIEAVVSLEQPDRVPVGPLLDHFAATYSGFTNAEIMTDGNKRIAAVLKTMHELGPWDITFIGETVNANMLKVGLPMKLLLPGKELPENAPHQLEETEFLLPDDYDLLERVGALRFLWQLIGRNYPELKGLKALRPLISSMLECRKHAKMVNDAGAEVAAGFILPGILYDFFSLGRGIVAMSTDTFKRQDKIVAAGKVWAKTMTRMAIIGAKATGVPRVFIGCSRSAPEYISRKTFEKLVMPELGYVVNTLIDAGITPLLHCDCNWTKFFDLFRKFPARKCILELDGTSDIFKAKEVLGDHMCIMGDVPAILTATGTKDEVLNYCKRLIKEVGKGGSSGCSLPVNAKPDNVRAFYEAVEEWGWY